LVLQLAHNSSLELVVPKSTDDDPQSDSLKLDNVIGKKNTT